MNMTLTEAIELLEENGFNVINEVGNRYISGGYSKDMGGVSKAGIDNMQVVSRAEAILKDYETGTPTDRKDAAWEVISKIIPIQKLDEFKARWDMVSPNNITTLTNMIGQAWAITSHNNVRRRAGSSWAGRTIRGL